MDSNLALPIPFPAPALSSPPYITCPHAGHTQVYNLLLAMIGREAEGNEVPRL